VVDGIKKKNYLIFPGSLYTTVYIGISGILAESGKRPSQMVMNHMTNQAPRRQREAEEYGSELENVGPLPCRLQFNCSSTSFRTRPHKIGAHK